MREIVKRIIIGIFTIISIIVMIIFVDFNKIQQNIIKISLLGVCLFMLIYTIPFALRSLRLKILFRGLNLQTSYLVLYGSYGVGWAINEITPGKIGDLARIEFIHQQEYNISRSKSICGISIERFIDLLILLLITAFALLYMYFTNVKGTTQLNLHYYIGGGALVLICGIIMLTILFFKTDLFLNIINKISPKFRDKLEVFLRNFLEGIHDFRKNGENVFFTIILSFVIWFVETMTLVMLFYLIGYEINIFIIILAQIVLFFTKTFPLTPGGWVISENAGALIVFLFYPSIPYSTLLSIFILDHILRVVYIFVYGLISTIAFNFKLKKIDLKELEEI